MTVRSLDDFDRKLLTLVQRDARLTAGQLGAELGLSASAVQKRLKRLRGTGVLWREVALLSDEALRGSTMFVVRVVLASGTLARSERLERTFAKLPEVTQCYHVTGDFDYLLIVHTGDISEFTGFVERRLKDNPDVARYETHVVMKSVKRSLEAPVLR
jgi:Lrp/AsnC family leucine-responsive transcriptional regulator